MSTARRLYEVALVGLLLSGCAEADPAPEAIEAGLFAVVTDGHAVEYAGASRGAAWGDFDGDGDPDLFVSHPTNEDAPQRNALYRNEDGLLVLDADVMADVPEGAWQGGAWVDVDRDGDLDLHIVGRNGSGSVFLENHEGSLTPLEHDPFEGRVTAASMTCWADADLDGLLDAFVIGSGDDTNHFFRNLGSWQMEELPLSDEAGGGGSSRACVWVDVDHDRFPDMVVANAREPNLLLRNRGGEGLVSDASSALRSDLSYGYGLSAADVNGDGLRDVFVANFDDDNALLLGTVEGRLEPAELGSQLQSPASKGHVWADFDLDGHIDLYLGSGTPRPGMFNRLWRGQGDGRFVLDTLGAFAMHADTSAAVAGGDIDGDGDTDLFVTNWGSVGSLDRLYLNGTTDRHWVRITLVGADSNTMGAEAKVSLLANRDGTPEWQHRWLGLSTGYAGQNEPVVHFGLGRAGYADSIVVVWPSGSVQALGRTTADQSIMVSEASGAN